MIFTGQEAYLVASDWFEAKGQAVIASALRVAPWAHAVGEDGFGVYADLRVGEAKQRMRWIPPGEFIMGSPETEEGRWQDEGPQRKVTFTKGFWMADTPCTQSLWIALMGRNQSRFKNNPTYPVENVSWDEVQEFLMTLGRFAPELNARLPTEEEWEYACRAGTAESRYGNLDDIAWYEGNSGYTTHRVGLKKPNPWGLYDMLGNVWEWTNSEVHGQERVFRGGSWDVLARRVRAASRDAFEPGDRLWDLGFRFIVYP